MMICTQSAQHLCRVVLALMVIIAAGCGESDGPVRSAGSIDIPEAALQSRSFNKLQGKAQAQAEAKAKSTAAH